MVPWVVCESRTFGRVKSSEKNVSPDRFKLYFYHTHCFWLKKQFSIFTIWIKCVYLHAIN